MRSTYPTNGFAGFVINGKARVIGAVKKGESWSAAPGVEPIFAATEADLLAIIADKGYTIIPIS
jgi:hypothetical protein